MLRFTFPKIAQRFSAGFSVFNDEVPEGRKQASWNCGPVSQSSALQLRPSLR
jgi:hypothetical protein